MKTRLAIINEPDIVSYLREINKYPLLSPTEEHMLANKVYAYQDISSAHTLVTSHLRLVVKIAMQMNQYGIALMDLISEGNLGLMHAVKKFNPALGFRFSSYAIWWIKASIKDFIIKSSSLIKIGTTIAQRKLFFNLHKAKKEIEETCNIDQNQLIAEALSVTKQDVSEMRARLDSRELSLDSSCEEFKLIDSIADASLDQEAVLTTKEEDSLEQVRLKEAIDKLSDRERDIIISRRINKSSTLKALSKKYGVSSERIRQIETRVMRKLRQYCLKI